MATFSKITLSGSTNGRGISVIASGSPGTTIHATGTSSTTKDEIWIYAVNESTTDRKLTIEFGAASQTDRIESTVKAESGLYLIIPGLILTGTGSAANTVTAFASGFGQDINIFGYVNRIS